MNGGGVMQLQKLYIKGFRAIEELTLDLEGRSTVLFGENGIGKSSVLKGIDALFANIINRIAQNKFRQAVSIEKEDVRYGHSLASLYAQFRFDNEDLLRYGFSYDKESGKRRIRRTELDCFYDLFTNSYLKESGAENVMPVFASYGVNRAVLNVPVRIRTKHEFGRIEAYQNAVSGTKTDFKTFFEWFRNQEDIENAEKVERGDLNYEDPALQAVRIAIFEMLPELSALRIMRRPLRMCAMKNGKNINVAQLSDGEKCILAMLGDLARRLALANPGSEHPLLGGGIVLIDEIELHMHPAWQRKIISTLQKIFPYIQFIITTHSPQVLGELPPEFKLLRLEPDANGAIQAEEMARGFFDSNFVLEDYMRTPSVDGCVRECEEELFHAIEERRFDEAEKLVGELSKLTNASDPNITRAQILLHRRKR